AMHSPLEQFLIKKIIPLSIAGVDISFTNASFFMVCITAFIIAFQIFGMRERLIIPGKFQSLVELSYEFTAGLVRDTAGKEGLAYFPFVLSLFMFVLVANLIGMIPYAYTVTSQ